VLRAGRVVASTVELAAVPKAASAAMATASCLAAAAERVVAATAVEVAATGKDLRQSHQSTGETAGTGCYQCSPMRSLSHH